MLKRRHRGPICLGIAVLLGHEVAHNFTIALDGVGLTLTELLVTLIRQVANVDAFHVRFPG